MGAGPCLRRPTSCASCLSFFSPARRPSRPDLVPPPPPVHQASFTWIRAHPYSLGLPSLASAGFPAVDAWVRRIEARPGAAKAVSGDMIEKLKADDGWEDKVRDKAKWVWEDEPSEKRKRDEL